MPKEDTNIIENYIKTANLILINLMYFNRFTNYKQVSKENLKEYNPGHLGSSLSINFILANLNYFFKEKGLKSQLIIGTGHSGASLITNKWLDGTLEKKDINLSRNIEGLNNLINNFGLNIRSEINPQYPQTIYNGGELGYSLGIAYGYSIDCNTDIIPCIIGDGEAETGTLSASWQLNKIIDSSSKVLPIINLNGLKMSSNSFLSNQTDEELYKYFESFGYDVNIVDIRTCSTLSESIDKFQRTLNKIMDDKHPLIILKSFKGYTLPSVDGIEFENSVNSHKNPLQNYDKSKKIDILRQFLLKYDTDFFDNDGFLLEYFKKIEPIDSQRKLVNINKINILEFSKLAQDKKLEEYLKKYFNENEGVIFSPDEIYSNKLAGVSGYAIEILNENLLQALYQGYILAGNQGFYIAYEGFMSIISSMVDQYYKSLKESNKLKDKIDRNSMNYILTSTCFENTYSHQNPNFVNNLLGKDDHYYDILFPKDKNNLLKCLEYIANTKNQINVITVSKRHRKIYQTIEDANIRMDTLIECDNPDIILCATGDYMLDVIFEVGKHLINNGVKVKINYITNPKILDLSSKNALNDIEFKRYFNKDVPTLYLYSGYAYIIKSLLYDRNCSFNIRGYEDGIAGFGNLFNNLSANGLSIDDIIIIAENMIKKK